MISDISNKAVVFLVTNTEHLNKEMFHVPYRRTASFVTIIWFFYLSLQRIYEKNIASAAFWDSKEYNQTTQDIFFKSSEKMT